MLKKQSGRCAICKEKPKPGARELAVDHDHATHKLRELLCTNCNKLAEDRERVEQVLAYLRRFE
jgi:hypothetical protein